jgi:hypothetical protein
LGLPEFVTGRIPFFLSIKAVIPGINSAAHDNYERAKADLVAAFDREINAWDDHLNAEEEWYAAGDELW